MKNEIKISKLSIVVTFISALLIVFCHNLNIDNYNKTILLPFAIMLVSYIIILRKGPWLNKKAYYLLIPIVLILISNLLIKIDYSNMLLNLIILPILLSMFFFLLTNRYYKISGKSLGWFFNLFPTGLFSNLHYIQMKFSKEENNKAFNIFLGVFIGGIFGFVILLLLMSADDYFNAFIGNITQLFHFDFNSIMVFIVSFIVLFSVLVNILLNQTKKMEKTTYQQLNETMLITVLSIINIIFVLFLISELSRTTVNFLQLPIQYTYSSYAREGFFQLLAVTVINFSIIMYLLYKSTIIKESKRVKKLILLLIGFSLILIFNSYYRMFLYIGNYGFTILRLQVILFLAMELVLFIALIQKLIKGFKHSDSIIYLIMMLSFYIVNLYLCTDIFIQFLNHIG